MERSGIDNENHGAHMIDTLHPIQEIGIALILN